MSGLFKKGNSISTKDAVVGRYVVQIGLRNKMSRRVISKKKNYQRSISSPAQNCEDVTKAAVYVLMCTTDSDRL